MLLLDLDLRRARIAAAARADTLSSMRADLRGRDACDPLRPHGSLALSQAVVRAGDSGAALARLLRRGGPGDGQYIHFAAICWLLARRKDATHAPRCPPRSFSAPPLFPRRSSPPPAPWPRPPRWPSLSLSSRPLLWTRDPLFPPPAPLLCLRNPEIAYG